jgi:hypothetical protein
MSFALCKPVSPTRVQMQRCLRCSHDGKNISVDARQKLQGTAQLTDIPREHRVKSLPIVEALIAMLPVDSPDRHDAEDKVEGTKKSLLAPT